MVLISDHKPLLDANCWRKILEPRHNGYVYPLTSWVIQLKNDKLIQD